ncbi:MULTISPECIES: alpha/beta fold hydrolase [Streptomyces]|uniref:Alpha/beta fold hydrolase n=1 Tax=Streptomyces luteosporeus TaxID=173856 RepID=A0ABN3TPQ1_9ACTN
MSPARPAPGPVRLYCFPHAGATSSVHRPWAALAAPRLQIVGVDAPGRGTRSREERPADFPALVTAMAEHLAGDLARALQEDPGLRWATFGHSFGAMTSLAVADAAARLAGRPPLRAVLSAALPPRLQQPDTTDDLTDDQLLEKIAADGGTPAGLLSNSAMSAYLVRLMREDYVIRRQFPRHAALRVDFPLTLVAARDDAYVTPAQMWQWAEHTTAACRRVEIPGGHFAAVQDPKQIVAIVTEDLLGAGEEQG